MQYKFCGDTLCCPRCPIFSQRYRRLIQPTPWLASIQAMWSRTVHSGVLQRRDRSRMHWKWRRYTHPGTEGESGRVKYMFVRPYTATRSLRGYVWNQYIPWLGCTTCCPTWADQRQSWICVLMYMQGFDRTWHYIMQARHCPDVLGRPAADPVHAALPWLMYSMDCCSTQLSSPYT